MAGSMTDIEQTRLARERTHAAWLRTCLAFLVATVAFRHYIDMNGYASSFALGILGMGGALSAVRAALLAPDNYTKMQSWLMAFVSIVAMFLPLNIT